MDWDKAEHFKEGLEQGLVVVLAVNHEDDVTLAAAAWRVKKR